MADISIEGPIVEGSIVWLHNVDLDDEGFVESALTELRAHAGHDRFVVVASSSPMSKVEVVGSPEELVKRVCAVLAEEGGHDA